MKQAVTSVREHQVRLGKSSYRRVLLKRWGGKILIKLKKDAAPKKHAGGDDELDFFFIWPYKIANQIVEQFIIISSEKVKILIKILVFFSNATIFFLLSTRPYTQYFPEPDKYRFTELQI